MDVVAGQADNPFYKILLWVHRIAEHYDIAALNGPVGKYTVPKISVVAEMHFVHQHKVANQQRIFHGLRRYPESLNHKGDHEYCDHQNGEHRLETKQGGAVRQM